MKIGFIGLGNVGAKLAGSLLRNGFELTVRDIDRAAGNALIERGAIWADTAQQIAETSDIIITCLPSPDVSAQVMETNDGVIAGLSANKVWLEMSTTDQAEVKRLGALVAARGAIPMDSPVSGGCHRAATGNISIFTGGDRAGFEKALPALTVMGRRVLHTGPLGSASVMKVVTNYLAGVQLVSTGEAFMVAKRAGVDLGVVYEAIRISSGNSFVHETEGQLILNGSYNINFTMDHEVKDVTLFDELGKNFGVPLELSPLVVDIMRDGLKRYGPRVWSSMVVKRLEDACGADLRAPGFPEVLVDNEPEQTGFEVTVPGV
ncbi:MAG: NAD(P)-dependent oxidoreductase [Gammaproteobacteria bacterium]|nr:NAD(P)-dependent oxidoreductase [Gammaproteobacteria bacterium]MDH3466971.1 NAD(P)-dependent oxidoreductase [Gammaproteobacteria bacterium]